MEKWGKTATSDDAALKKNYFQPNYNLHKLVYGLFLVTYLFFITFNVQKNWGGTKDDQSDASNSMSFSM